MQQRLGADLEGEGFGVVGHDGQARAVDADTFAQRQLRSIGRLAQHETSGRGASIVNMSSIAGSIRGLPNRFVYGASKAAVIGLTKSVAADYVQKGIRCNAIAPGTVDTPSLADRINAFPDPVEARKAFIARQPMGRLAKPEEIAPLVVFLASEEAAFVTGNVYACDGGMTI